MDDIALVDTMHRRAFVVIRLYCLSVANEFFLYIHNTAHLTIGSTGP